MAKDYHQFEQRKRDHIDIVLGKPTQTTQYSGLDDFQLIHEALPDLNFEDISLSTRRFQEETSSPFLVSSMTAGHKGSIDINQVLMTACQETGWIMGVGSQRRELSDDSAAREWKGLIKKYPDVELLSNIGIAQLCQTPFDTIKRLIDSLSARGIIVHLNALQECIQPEGTPQFKGGLQALSQLVKESPVPVIVKETGCGFSKKTLQRLNNIGIAAVDVSGLGGTHWGRVEGYRAQENSMLATAAQTYARWGITTLNSILNAKSINPNFEIWGSGGVRNGLDAAKMLTLGATTVGLAKPLLTAALTGTDAVVHTMKTLEHELKIALFCTGSKNIAILQENHHGFNI